MICKGCRAAGNLRKAGPSDRHPEKQMTEMAHRAKVENMYKDCPGGTWCDRNPRIPEIPCD